MIRKELLTKLDFIMKNIRGVNDVLMYVVVTSFLEREMIKI